MGKLVHTLVGQKPRALFLFGPTASGKTRLAIELHEQFACQLISVDSAMVYRGLDIGSAKPTWHELQKAPHRLIDICDPAQSYNAAQFCQDALNAMQEIYAKGQLPVLVGGTMLYFKLLFQGHSQLPATDAQLRTQLQQRQQQLGTIALYEELTKVDPVSAARLHPHDTQRIMRALEVWYLTGVPLSHQWQQTPPQRLPWQITAVALMPQHRDVLHQLIARRFDQMLAQGLLEEVEALFSRGDLHADLPALKSVGYRQVWEYLSGQVDFNTMREKAIIATRQLAKRQITWIRQWPNVHCFDAQDEKLTTKLKEIVCA